MTDGHKIGAEIEAILKKHVGKLISASEHDVLKARIRDEVLDYLRGHYTPINFGAKTLDDVDVTFNNDPAVLAAGVLDLRFVPATERGRQWLASLMAQEGGKTTE